MSLYLILSDFVSFDKGTLLSYDLERLTDSENSDKFINFNDKIDKDWLKIPEFCSSLLLKMGKANRLNIAHDDWKKIVEDFSILDNKDSEIGDGDKIRHNMSGIFMRGDSTLNPDELKAVNDDDGFLLVKLRWKDDIYGRLTKYYNYGGKQYCVVQLLDDFINIISDSIPECLFDEGSSIVIDHDFVELIESKQRFIKDSALIDHSGIINMENGTSDKFKDGDYVKFTHGGKKEIGVVQNCLIINGQHCLNITLLRAGIIQPNEKDLYYIREEDAVKKSLEQLTKYCEGVIIMPGSVIAVDTVLCTNNVRVGDYVNVTLRDSLMTYACSVIWLGRVNHVEVAAVQWTTEITIANLESLVWNGKFDGKEYLATNSYLVALPSITKISIGEQKLQDIADMVKKSGSKLSIDVRNQLEFVRDNISSISIYNHDFCKLLLKLCYKILKILKRDFISGKLQTTKNDPFVPINDQDKLLLDCSAIMLEIIADVCAKNCQITKAVSEDTGFQDVFESIFNKLYKNYDIIVEMKPMFANMMFILWNIVKQRNVMFGNVKSGMMELLTKENTDYNIKLAAALNMSFIADNISDILIIASRFLKQSFRDFATRNDTHRYITDDLLIGMGKIFVLYDLPSKLEKCADQSSPSQNVISFKECSDDGTLAEEECTVQMVSSKEYEECIEKLIENPNDDSRDYIINCLDKMSSRKLLLQFLKKQTTISLDKCPGLLFSNRHDDPIMKVVLEIASIDVKQYSSLLDLADSLLNECNTTNIEGILGRINNEDGSLDHRMLQLAYKCLWSQRFELFKTVISECKDRNSLMSESETFVTYMMQQKLDNTIIITAIENGGFDINKKNKSGKSPIVIANDFQNREIFDFLIKNQADPTAISEHYESS